MCEWEKSGHRPPPLLFLLGRRRKAYVGRKRTPPPVSFMRPRSKSCTFPQPGYCPQGRHNSLPNETPLVVCWIVETPYHGAITLTPILRGDTSIDKVHSPSSKRITNVSFIVYRVPCGWRGGIFRARRDRIPSLRYCKLPGIFWSPLLKVYCVFFAARLFVTRAAEEEPTA